MGTELIRASVHQRFRIAEKGHACAILDRDFSEEFTDLQDCLDAFTLLRSQVITPGGNKSAIALGINGFFSNRGWDEKKFDVAIRVDGVDIPSPTHSIDYFKNRVGIEVE